MSELLQPLFPQPILRAVSLDPGYQDHGSDVWLVETAAERVVVRSSRIQGPTDELNDFWWGCRHLFGIQPWQTFDLEVIHAVLSEASGFRIPQVLRKGEIEGRQFIVVEWLAGAPLGSFAELSEEALVEFGRGLAAIHNRTFDFCGHLTRRVVHALSEFHERVAETMRGRRGGSTLTTSPFRPPWTRCARRFFNFLRRRRALLFSWTWIPLSFLWKRGASVLWLIRKPTGSDHTSSTS